MYTIVRDVVHIHAHVHVHVCAEVEIIPLSRNNTIIGYNC